MNKILVVLMLHLTATAVFPAGSFLGTPSGDDAYFWWVTSNVQYLPGNL